MSDFRLVSKKREPSRFVIETARFIFRLAGNAEPDELLRLERDVGGRSVAAYGQHNHDAEHTKRGGEHPSCFFDEIGGAGRAEELLGLAAKGLVNAATFRVLDEHRRHQKQADEGDEDCQNGQHILIRFTF